MQLKKQYLEPLFLLTQGTDGQLSLPEARVRDKFMKTVNEVTQEYEGHRKVIYEKFCTKTEDGKPDIADGKYHFDKEQLPEVNKELETLLAETVEIATPEGLKDILEKSAYKPRVGEAESIDHILSLV